MSVPTKLELHRLKYVSSGYTCELLKFESLEDSEIKLVVDEIFSTVAHERDRLSPYEIYSGTLASWGVMCPHPPQKRIYSGGKQTEYINTDDRWYLCSCCGCYVFNDSFRRRADW